MLMDTPLTADLKNLIQGRRSLLQFDKLKLNETFKQFVGYNQRH